MAVVSRCATCPRHDLIRHELDRKICVGNSLSWDSAKKAPQRIVGGVGSTRGSRVIVAASPPTEDAVVATHPLTKQDLVDYLASGCKPKEKWRIFEVSVTTIAVALAAFVCHIKDHDETATAIMTAIQNLDFNNFK
ncbi:Glutamate--cysteine ligase [Spatholobus suberectus]|nr:Glutamate--cysteine ligase [Spatholobus suberectus]